MLIYQGFHYLEWCQKILHCFQDRSFRFLNSHPEDHAIPSGRLSDHCSIRPDDLPYHQDASQTKHHPSGRRAFSVQASTVSRSYCSSVYSFGRLSSPSGRLSVIDQLQILSKFRITEDWYTRPNALIYKARIAIQILPSGRQSTLVRMCVQLIWKLPIWLQPSGSLPLMVRMRA
jgi:hypothetical protein